MIRPPSRSTSLSRNVTPCSAAAAWIVRTSASRASAAASAPSVAIDLVEAREAHERDRAVAVLAFERADLEELRAERRRDRELEWDALGRRGSV